MLNLLKKDLKIWFTGKRIWTILLGVLIILIIGTSWHVNEEESKDKFISIGVVDYDDSEYSRMMISYFEESDVFTEYANVVVGDEKEIEDMFLRGELTMYLIVPENFAQNLIDIKNVPMKAYISTADTARAIILKNMLLAYEKYISAVEINCVSLYEIMKEAGMPYELRQKVNIDISMDLVFTALGKTDFFDIEEMSQVKNVPLIVYYGFEVIFLFLSYLAMSSGMDLLQERRQGMLARMLSNGTRMMVLLTEKLLFGLLLMSGLFTILYVILTTRGVDLPVDVIFFLLLYYAAGCTFFILLSTWITRIPTFLLFSNVLILFGTVLGGGLIPILYLPESMKIVAKVTPNFWFLNTATSLYLKEVKLMPSVVAGIVTGIVVLLIASAKIIGRKEGMRHEGV